MLFTELDEPFNHALNNVSAKVVKNDNGFSEVLSTSVFDRNRFSEQFMVIFRRWRQKRGGGGR